MSQSMPSSGSFVPFEPVHQPAASPESVAGGRLKVLSSPSDKVEFNPLAPRSPAPPVHAAHGTAGAAPTVTLQREGERVIGIRVECVCGQVIELACS